MKYVRITTQHDLMTHMDSLISAVHKMLGRTGEHGQTVERVVKMMISYVASPYGFLLLVFDEEEFVGFVFAVATAPPEAWVEVVGMWSKPGVASTYRFEGYEHLAAWAREVGAKKILSIITRSPKRFYNFFHKPLGFKVVGLLVEKELSNG